MEVRITQSFLDFLIPIISTVKAPKEIDRSTLSDAANAYLPAGATKFLDID